MEKEKCVIATQTLYRSPGEARAELAIQMFRAASEHGFHVVCSDGGSYEDFRDDTRDLGVELLDESESGMGPGRRQAIKRAMEVVGPGGAVCFIEPEKGPLVKHLNSCFELISKGADIVVPRRSRQSWKTYPRLQRLSEPFGNYSLEMAVGRKDLDIFFGARVFNVQAGGLFLERRPDIPGENSWGTTLYPVIDAIHRGLKVVSVIVDYLHPPEQAATENNLSFYTRRLAQITELATGTFIYAMKLGLIQKESVLIDHCQKSV